MKFLVAAIVVFAVSPAVASHPHQRICVVTENRADGDHVQLLLQIESERQYKVGDPDNDGYNFRYQARICDDDNRPSSCSTYESKAVGHHPEVDDVTLVGMKDKTAVLFRGRITQTEITGKVLMRDGAQRTLAPFTAKLDKCIAQSWVRFAREANSRTH